MTDQIEAVVVRGQGIAGSQWLSRYSNVYESVLGPVYPATLNVRIRQVFQTWRHQVGPFDFNKDARFVPCTVNEVPSFVVFVESPAPSYKEGHDEIKYFDKTMLEIICSEWVPDAPYDATVQLQIELSAL